MRLRFERPSSALLLLVALTLLFFVSLTLAAQEAFRSSTDEADKLCGPISLGAIAQRLGSEADLPTILRMVEIGPEGTSLAALAKAARELGFVAKGNKFCSVSDLSALSGDTPAIVQLHGSHFVAVWGAGGSDIWMADYPRPLHRVSAESLEDTWDPRVLIIHRADESFHAPICLDSLPLWLGGTMLLLAASLAAYRHAFWSKSKA